MSAARDEAVSLGATRNCTVALPCPDEGESPEIHSAPGVARHAHSGAAVTAKVDVPPAASITDGGVSDS